jgi:hypothetical protein
MSDEPVPNLRGGNFEMMVGFVKPFVAVALFVASLVWQASSFASKTAMDQMRDDMWNARLEAKGLKDAVEHLTAAVNEIHATQVTQQAAAAAAAATAAAPRRR